MRERRVRVAFFAAGLGAGALAALVVARPTTVSPAPRSELMAGAEGRARSARPRAESAPEDLRARIKDSIAAALAEQRRGRALELILDELAAQARAQGQVTALEVQTGLAAIGAAYPGDQEREAAFTLRMETLQRELTPAPAAPEGDESAARAALRAAETLPPGEARDGMTPVLLAAIRRLPSDEQDEALAALDRATQAQAPARPESTNDILSDLGRTTDARARRDLVQRYLRATANSSAEEQAQHLRALDEATATAASMSGR